MATIKEIFNKETISKKLIRDALRDGKPVGQNWDKHDFGQLHRMFQIQAEKDCKCNLTVAILRYFCENVSFEIWVSYTLKIIF